MTCRNPEEKRSVLHRALSSATEQATMIDYSLYLSHSLTSSRSDIVPWICLHSLTNLPQPAHYRLYPPSHPAEKEMKKSSPPSRPSLPSKANPQHHRRPNPNQNSNPNPNPSSTPNRTPKPNLYPYHRRNHQRSLKRNPQLLPIQSPVPGALKTRSCC